MFTFDFVNLKAMKPRDALNFLRPGESASFRDTVYLKDIHGILLIFFEGELKCVVEV